MELFIAKLQPGASIPLKIFFGLIEIAIIASGIYLLRQGQKFFGHKGQEGDDYASSNLRTALVVLVWIHATILTGIMIFEV